MVHYLQKRSKPTVDETGQAFTCTCIRKNEVIFRRIGWLKDFCSFVNGTSVVFFSFFYLLSVFSYTVTQQLLWWRAKRNAVMNRPQCFQSTREPSSRCTNKPSISSHSRSPTLEYKLMIIQDREPDTIRTNTSDYKNIRTIKVTWMWDGERGVMPGSPMLFAGEGLAIASVEDDRHLWVKHHIPTEKEAFPKHHSLKSWAGKQDQECKLPLTSGSATWGSRATLGPLTLPLWLFG